MGKVENSALLTEMIEAAKRIGNKPNPPFTEERFFVALIDRVQA